jgi:hypothetical protein
LAFSSPALGLLNGFPNDFSSMGRQQSRLQSQPTMDALQINCFASGGRRVKTGLIHLGVSGTYRIQICRLKEKSRRRLFFYDTAFLAPVGFFFDEPAF